MLFDFRASGIANTINKLRPDVVFLVEIRNLEAAKTTVRKFIEMFHPRYDVHYVPYNSDVFTFYAAILVNRERLWACESRTIPLGNLTPDDGRRRICTGLLLCDRVTLKRLWVFTTHFHIYEDIKNESVENLISALGDCKDPFVLTGDFNLFFDKDGQKQYDRLAEGLGAEDVTYPLMFVDDDGSHAADGTHVKKELVFQVDGTFHGYDYDAYKANVVCHPSSKLLTGLSKLDLIWTKGMKKTSPTNVRGFTVDDLVNNRGLSDHLPLFVELEFDTST